MSGRTVPHRYDNIAVCPRCGTSVSTIDRVCTNPDCSWPNPEPGLINLMRYRMANVADAALQRLRAQGKWPPLP